MLFGSALMTVRTAHPYADLDVIDSRAPRTNQAIIGTLALLAFMIEVKFVMLLHGCASATSSRSSR